MLILVVFFACFFVFSYWSRDSCFYFISAGSFYFFFPLFPALYYYANGYIDAYIHMCTVHALTCFVKYSHCCDCIANTISGKQTKKKAESSISLDFCIQLRHVGQSKVLEQKEVNRSGCILCNLSVVFFFFCNCAFVRNKA